MKKYIIISVAAFLVLAVVLCIFVIPFYRLPAPITLWDKRQVEKEYLNYMLPVFHTLPSWMDRNGEGGSTFYYGKYNGYYIICDAINIDISNSEEVGGYFFDLGSHVLRAHKDGKSYGLDTLYASGEISDKNLATIYEYHKNNPMFALFYEDE